MVTTTCPAEFTVCNTLATRCPVDPTVCETTVCPIDATVCPFDPTVCGDVTNCPDLESSCYHLPACHVCSATYDAGPPVGHLAPPEAALAARTPVEDRGEMAPRLSFLR